MTAKSGIVVEQVVLVGRRKNYVTKLSKGVNIIYGDSSTGKSSIVELIDYMLGGSKFIYDEEIESSVEYAMLELTLSGNLYVIKRDIFDASKLVEIYPSSIKNMGTVFPKKVAAKFGAQSGPDGYLSDFLMTALEMPILKVRQAPTQAESKMVRLSFRDVFKFCYLNQDDVGSKRLLALGEWQRFQKNKQTFKYIFNLLDTKITDLEQELGDITGERNRLTNKYKVVSDFLRETEFETATGLVDTQEELEEQAAILQQQLESINTSIVSSSENYIALKDVLNIVSSQILQKEQGRQEAEIAIERYTRLKNDYRLDIDKLKAIAISQEVIGEPSSDHFLCPVCETELSTNEFEDRANEANLEKVNHEVSTLTRRMKDLSELIEQEKGKFVTLGQDLSLLYEDQLKARRMLDAGTAEAVTPYLSQRDGVAAELATVRERMNQLHRAIKIRNQQQVIFKEIDNYSVKIERLEERLSKLREAAPSLGEVTSDLGDLLNQYLKDVNIKDRRDVSISTSTFLPMLRNRDYGDITSGGLRTILSIGYFSSLLEYSFDHEVNFPRLMMIDTVGKYLGKTQEKYVETNNQDDVREGVSDPSKYANIYDYLIKISRKAEEKNSSCQIILVDNDVPQNVTQEFSGFVVAQFSSTGEDGLPIGLIDDIDSSSGSLH